MRKIYYLSAIFVVILIAASVIQNFFQKTYYPSSPDQNSFIRDSANIISQNDYDFINKNLKDINSKTDISFYIVTIGKLSGISLNNYGIELLKRWKIDPESNCIAIIITNGNNDSEIISTKSMNSVMEFTLREKTIHYSSFYFKQYGLQKGLYYIYNNVAASICGKYNINNSYSYNPLPEIYVDNKISTWFVISSILLLLLLALFYGISYDTSKYKYLMPGDELLLSKSNLASSLKIYIIEDAVIATVILEFMILFGSYMFELYKFKEYLISTGIMLIIFAPVFNDLKNTVIDFAKNETVNIEGTVQKSYWSYFRYNIVIKDTDGNYYVMNSLKCYAKKNNYIKASYTKNIKYITYINIVYENIVLN